jgi:regulator of protease activity HflC (stomatin/prohibitin superfamily)
VFVPFVDRVHRVSLRNITMPIQSQGITRDDVSVDVSAVAYYRVADVLRSVVAIENASAAIDQIAQTTLRAVVGRHPLDETLSETDTDQPEHPRDPRCPDRGVGMDVTVVELRDIQLPDSMQRAWPVRPRPSARSAPRVPAARDGEPAAA